MKLKSRPHKLDIRAISVLSREEIWLPTSVKNSLRISISLTPSGKNWLSMLSTLSSTMRLSPQEKERAVLISVNSLLKLQPEAHPIKPSQSSCKLLSRTTVRLKPTSTVNSM